MRFGHETLRRFGGGWGRGVTSAIQSRQAFLFGGDGGGLSLTPTSFRVDQLSKRPPTVLDHQRQQRLHAEERRDPVNQ